MRNTFAKNSAVKVVQIFYLARMIIWKKLLHVLKDTLLFPVSFNVDDVPWLKIAEVVLLLQNAWMEVIYLLTVYKDPTIFKFAFFCVLGQLSIFEQSEFSLKEHHKCSLSVLAALEQMFISKKAKFKMVETIKVSTLPWHCNIR